MNYTKKTKEDWTLDQVADFWDWYSSKSRFRNRYFTASVGKGIKNFIKGKIKLSGKYLDYGSGTGHMLELMMAEKGLQCYGADFSENSVDDVNKKLNGDNWNGAELLRELPSTLKSDGYDIVTFIETIEHLKDDMLDDTFKELYRVLKPGGKLILTTPFNEELDMHNVYCPFCKSEFHHMQHMQSFDVSSMSSLLEKYSFKVDYCDHINFKAFKSFKDNMLFKLSNVVQNRPNNNRPHLVAIGTKK